MTKRPPGMTKDDSIEKMWKRGFQRRLPDNASADGIIMLCPSRGGLMKDHILAISA